MKQITELSSEPKQTIRVLLPTKELLQLNLEFKPNQNGWFFGFTYGATTIGNLRLTARMNILREYQNTLPFGLACVTNDGLEPWFLQDFTTGRVKMYVLTPTEVQTIENDIYVKE